MSVGEASAFLAQFASGEAEVCGGEERAHLRGAVRAYGREMAANGVAWPQFNPAEARAQGASATDLAVIAAFSLGFVERDDLMGVAQRIADQAARAHLADIARLRGGANQACAEFAALLRAATGYMAAVERQEALRMFAERNGGAAHDLALVHVQAVRRAESDLRVALHVAEARLGAR
ncbi:MAG TPA: hypothetical protein PKY87_06160 [Terricaulis sp.]|nr:hypothetical protein [Terricaulis sp.]